MRDMLFLSHANPEDNEFALWLSLQLASHGYPVWCDLTKLLGGEDWWRDIEQAIRDRTAKFLYVLSRTSNIKPGPRRELQLAQGIGQRERLHDFIIPLHIDDLPHSEINILLHPINAITFERGWAKGLNMLLEKLEQESVPKSVAFTPSAVTSWWRTHFSAAEGVIDQREEELSNWFPIRELPKEIYFHALTRTTIGKVEIESEEKLPYPGFQHERFLISFAKAADFAGKLGDSIVIESTKPFPTEDFLAGTVGHGSLSLKAARKEGRDFVYRLLRLGWQLMLTLRGLPIYELAKEAKCFWFKKGFAEGDSIWFNGVKGERTHRQMVGYSTVSSKDGKDVKRYWHFGIQAKPLLYPAISYILKAHVVFSDDGVTVWDKKKRTHRARRSQCKNWWNPQWRDRILAAMTWLADDKGEVQLPLGSDILLHISNTPLPFSSPVSYIVAKGDGLPFDEYEDEDDEDEDEDEPNNRADDGVGSK